MGNVPALVFAILVACSACGGQSATVQRGASLDYTLVGQLLLPSGAGSRGVEILVSLKEADGEPPVVWVLFDEQGRFAEPFGRRATSIEVTAGQGAKVHRLDAEQLPVVDEAGRLDLGVIDLRDRLKRYSQILRPAEGTPSGEFRIAMWENPPPRSPTGESVSLGSRQFPTRQFGEQLEWLVSIDAKSVYFLVERPSDATRWPGWNSGRQRLFGPFSVEELPAELIMD